MAQVVSNLLQNAAKYMDEGGVIALTVERESGRALIRVRDTGIGIRPEMLAHIFELFTQGERAVDRSRGGLGIGLTVVRKLVEMHGGAVSVRSGGPGKGSEFLVALPLLSAEEAHRAIAPRREAEPPAAPRRVLIVDDDKDASDSIATLSALWGHETRAAYDGPAALRIARELHPHIVLLDLGMPGMDGYEVARRLREEHGEGLRIVAVTGYGQEDDRRATRAAGFDEHLVKPFDPAVLRQLLNAAPLLC